MRGFPGNPFVLALAASTGLHAALLALPDLGRITLLERRAENRMMVTLVAQYPPPEAASEAAPVAGATEGAAGSSPNASAIPLDTPDPRFRGYFGVIKGMIARHWEYPTPARARGERGEVVLEFTLDREGALRGVRVADSSGNALLDEAASEAVRRAAPYPPCPADIRRDPFTVSALFIYGG